MGAIDRCKMSVHSCNIFFFTHSLLESNALYNTLEVINTMVDGTKYHMSQKIMQMKKVFTSNNASYERH